MRRTLQLAIIAMLVAATMLVGISACEQSSAAAGEKFTVDGATFQVLSGTDVTLTAVGGIPLEYDIPSTVSHNSVSYTVTAVGDSAFAMKGVTKVTIPSSVAVIGEKAFVDCTALTAMEIGKNVTDIGEKAFLGCTSLTAIKVDPGNAVYYSSDGVLCSHATSENKETLVCFPAGKGGDFTVPSNIVRIEKYAFVSSAIEKLTMTSSVKEVGYSALANCRSLETVSIDCPIGGLMFSGCTALKNVTLGADVPLADMHAFIGCSHGLYFSVDAGNTNYSSVEGSLFSHDKATMLFYHSTGYAAYEMPMSVTEIAYGAFRGCTELTSVTFDENLIKIGDFAFCGCSSLSTAVLGNNVCSVGEAAFKDCASLTSIYLGSTGTCSADVLSGCTKLIAVTFSTPPTEIDSGAFEDCASLVSVDLSDVEAIGSRAFGGCSSLASVSLSDDIYDFSSDAFYGCTSLMSIEVSSWFFESVDGVVIHHDSESCSSVFIYPCGRTGPYTVPAGITLISDGAFGGCASLTSVVLPEGLTAVGAESFRDCVALTDVSFPSTLTAIGNDAFNGCISLKEAVLPSGLQSIGIQSFAGCTGLLKAAIPAGKIGNQAFSNCIALSDLVLGNGVESIGSSAFAYCTALREVSIPDSAAADIGSGAFEYCTSLENVRLPEGLAEIPERMFSGCVSMGGIMLPYSLHKIGIAAFAGCWAGYELDVPFIITSIGDGAFSDVGLVVIPARHDPLTLSSYAFQMSVLLPAGVRNGNEILTGWYTSADFSGQTIGEWSPGGPVVTLYPKWEPIRGTDIAAGAAAAVSILVICSILLIWRRR
jgi:hypothetical protein